MAFSADAARAAELLLSRVGESATYTPLSGTPVAARVFVDRGVDRYIVGDGQVLATQPRTLATVRVAEIQTSRRGDMIALGAETWVVDEIERDDGFLRTLVLRKAA